MSNYIPNYKKKKNFFLQREQELRHALRNNAPDAKVKRAVDRLRAAKFQIFKAERARIIPIGGRDEYFIEKIENGEEFWTQLTDEEIVEMYQTQHT
ncbi:MAG: DUF4175 domain-containing protein [Deltaproteobacteria bacterium]|nr:DUF4175 domain-containing protein [Deltaproteobacteria bacterium]